MALERKQYTYTPFTYREYEKSTDVQAAEGKQNELASKVEGWTPATFSKNEEYQNLLSSYQNRPDFTYDFNADALYQQYKDKYIQQGKMAMADTMGQAAAMTGGYGNSYAQTVGNQAYQASLQNLNDIIPQLYQMAYDRYNQKGQDMLNTIGLLSNERDYERNLDNDAYNRLVANLDYATTNAQNLFNRDYGMYSADREIAQGEHSNTEKYKYQDVADANAFAQWLEEQALNERQVALAEKQYEDSKNASNGNNGGGNDQTGNADTLWYATGTYDDSGNPIFRNSKGQTQAFGAGINPYTGTKHPDAKHGTFSNGYQPNNINGTKLKDSGMSTNITGKNQTIWEANGKKWLWRGDENRYVEIEVDED